MAVVTVKTTLITALDAGTPVGVTSFGGRVRSQIGTYEVANGDSIASIYRFFRVKSNWRLLRLAVKCDAITSATADIGLYQIAANGGAVVDVDAYATAQAISSAITTVENNVLYEVRDIANVAKRVYEDAGLSTDPGLFYDIAFTLTAAATAGGTLTATLDYVID